MLYNNSPIGVGLGAPRQQLRLAVIAKPTRIIPGHWLRRQPKAAFIARIMWYGNMGEILGTAGVVMIDIDCNSVSFAEEIPTTHLRNSTHAIRWDYSESSRRHYQQWCNQRYDTSRAGISRLAQYTALSFCSIRRFWEIRRKSIFLLSTSIPPTRTSNKK